MIAECSAIIWQTHPRTRTECIQVSTVQCMCVLHQMAAEVQQTYEAHGASVVGSHVDIVGSSVNCSHIASEHRQSLLRSVVQHELNMRATHQ